MSTIEEVSNTGNFAIINKNTAKTFIFDNSFKDDTLLNATAGELTYEVGTLLGRVTASGKLVPLTSAAIDGSAIPVGILAREVTLAASGEDVVPVCIKGEVAKEKLILQGADTLATVIDGRTIEDRIMADTMGIKLVSTDELTATDNS